MLRSTDPVGVEQDMWALLVLYQALRRAMITAVESKPGASHLTSLTTTITDPEPRHTPNSSIVHGPLGANPIIGTQTEVAVVGQPAPPNVRSRPR